MCDSSKPYAASGDACYPLGSTADPGWTLAEIFGRRMTGVCPLIGKHAPSVCIDVPDEREVHVSPGAVEHRRKHGRGRCYKVPGKIIAQISLIQNFFFTNIPFF